MHRAWMVLLVLTACRGGGSSAPDDPAADFLVWRADGQRAETRWVDAAGTERGRADGIHVAAGGTVWRLDRTQHKLATRGCRMDDDGKLASDAAGTAELTDLAAISADGGTSLVIVRTDPSQVADYETYDHGVAVMGSLGPLVFGDESVDEYACGAHGGQAVSAFTFDLATRSGGPVAARAAPAPLGPKIRAAFEREAIEGDTIDSAPRIGETVPRWIDGKLAAHHLVFVDTCYACGNGMWSSYTSGVWIDDVRIPDEWAIGAEVPARVAALLGGGAEFVPAGVSWGVPDDGWRARFASR